MLKGVLFCFFLLLLSPVFGTLEESGDSSVFSPDGFRVNAFDFIDLCEKAFEHLKQLKDDEISQELATEALDLFIKMLPALERSQWTGGLTDYELNAINQKINAFEGLDSSDIFTIFTKSIQKDIMFFLTFFRPSLHIVLTNGSSKKEFIQSQAKENLESIAEMKSYILDLFHHLYSAMDRSCYLPNVLRAYEAVYGEPTEFSFSGNANKGKWPVWFALAFYSLVSILFLEVALSVFLAGKRRSNSAATTTAKAGFLAF